MIQSVATQPAPPAPAPDPRAVPRVWGLGADELHDAFWNARGVQCVRRGRAARLQRAAELYLLVEAEQLVLFGIADLSERMTWRNALVTRVRLVDETDESYSERVVLDGDRVERIERRYRPRFQQSTRVILTPSRRVAALWMQAASRREGWDRVRRSVPWSRVDHARCAGRVYEAGDPRQRADLLDDLVARWPRPDQVIAGIQSTEDGVWHPADEPLEPDVAYVGPLWVGSAARAGRPCVVGPAWLGDDAEAAVAAAPVRDIAEVELADAVRPAPAPASAGIAYPAAKRLLDVVASALALTAALPVMIVIAVFILAEDGRPIFFGHTRQGRGGRPFRCWKFRTMHRDAERIVRELQAQNMCDGPQVFIRNDPRVTRTGRFLRTSHLDELPQLWNVLLGQMSLVGPRPSPDDENQYCPAWRDSRLSVRPGITGLWQLQRTRAEGEDFQEWIKFDIEYVQRAGFWFDVLILCKTARLVVLGRPKHASE